MIYKILSAYTAKLEDFIESLFVQPEGIVKIGDISSEQKEEEMNKLRVTLLSVERETTQGIAGGQPRNGSGAFSNTLPPLWMNLNVIFAAVYETKRYGEALSVLSAVLLFLQANPFFTLNGRQRYTIEVVTVSDQDLNNIWTGMGGHYYPSVVCKIRGLVFNAGEIRGSSGCAGKPETGVGKKNDGNGRI